MIASARESATRNQIFFLDRKSAGKVNASWMAKQKARNLSWMYVTLAMFAPLNFPAACISCARVSGGSEHYGPVATYMQRHGNVPHKAFARQSSGCGDLD